MTKNKDIPIFITQPEFKITYEVSHNTPLHPDPKIASRMYEFRLSNCEHGCKLYKDPWSDVVVLAHNSSYGCTK